MKTSLGARREEWDPTFGAGERRTADAKVRGGLLGGPPPSHLHKSHTEGVRLPAASSTHPRYQNVPHFAWTWPP